MKTARMLVMKKKMVFMIPNAHAAFNMAQFLLMFSDQLELFCSPK